MKARGPQEPGHILELQENWRDWSLELGALGVRTVENWAGSGQGVPVGHRRGSGFVLGAGGEPLKQRETRPVHLGSSVESGLEEAGGAARQLPVRQGSQGQSGGSRGGESGAT